MSNVKDQSKKEDLVSFKQIDITNGYKKALEKIIHDKNDNLTPNIREKIYPSGVQKITYSPQTESIYYYENEEDKLTSRKKSWDIFEDRGALVESKLIENLAEIKEIKEDYRKISKEEKLIEDMQNGEIIDAIMVFVKKNGSKGYRCRQDSGAKQKCRICSFQRANVLEEIILFSDKYLVLERSEGTKQPLQKAMKYINRTVIAWYYEGLLRMQRLDEKQRKYFRKTT
ncbi:MAG: hypothetical protein V3V41_01450 [Candidatus Heimdallarchaeota archaeon]